MLKEGINMKQGIIKTISILLTIPLLCLFSGCATMPSGTGSGAGKPFYKKKGFWYSVGALAVVGIAYSLSQSGGGSSGGDEEVASPSTPSRDTSTKTETTEAPAEEIGPDNGGGL